MPRSLRTLGVLVVVLVLSSGCAGVKVEQYADTTPALVLEEYFAGPLTAWGIVQDRGGKVTRQFVAEMHGEPDGDAFLLHERFTFDDGEVTERTWRLVRLDAHRFEGTAADVVGKAEGAAYGRAMNLRYTLQVPVGDKVYDLDFDDWLYLQPGGVIINRATMRKFGIRVGELTVVMQKGTQVPGRAGS